MVRAFTGFVFLLIAAAIPRPIHATIETKPAFYGVSGIGFRLMNNEDATRYFDGSSAGYEKKTFRSNNGFVLSVGLGYQFKNNFGLELGSNFGPTRTFDVSYPSSPYPLDVHSQWTSLEVYAMPVYRVWNEKSLFKRPAIQTFGLRLGSASLLGKFEASSNGQSGKYKSEGFANTYGLVYRYQQMFGRKFHLGLELAYDNIIFGSIQVSDGSGFYAGKSGVDTNFDNSRAAIDYSGVSLKVTVTPWFASPLRWAAGPVSKTVPEMATASESTSIPSDPAINESITLSEQSRQLGDTFFGARRYNEAADTYKQAAKLDPANARAWQGLGNAYYNLNKKAPAVEAYEKALLLEPGNLALRKFVERYKAKQ
jgi:hypothetical protein